MTDFHRLEGTLYVREPDNYPDHLDQDADQWYTGVVFDSDELSVVFYDGIGGHIQLKQSHLDDGDPAVYRPYQNETTAQIHVRGKDELDVYREDVAIEYARVDDDVFVRSQCEPTAYGGQLFVVDGQLYRLVDPLIARPGGESAPDEFLDIGAVEEPVRVENVESGHVAPVSYDRVDEIVDSPAANGALKLTEPDVSLHRMVGDL